ncbi:MAG: hypothetical protein HYR55_08390 [Acidobacteria bacterium]|nr:hypothetical protein [Acidobacteriota bacterium]MBI3658401.1 hypothetical protein [Acidobacteriota bacterium]
MEYDLIAIFKKWFLNLLIIGTAMAIMVGLGLAQEERKSFEVKLTPNDLYAFDTVSFRGDFLQFTAANGHMQLGVIDPGVTVVILMGAGEFKITSLPEFKEKVKEGFEVYPIVGKFTKAYVRLRPEDFEAMTKNTKLTKLPDEKVFNQAKEIYTEKFFGSYHAGDKATLPPERSIFVDFESDPYGQVIVEDGYWMRLVRIAPYKSIYPRGFEKPAKKL